MPQWPARNGGPGERLSPLVAVVPCAILAALGAVTLIITRGTGRSLFIDLGLGAVTALWMLWMFSLHPDWWGQDGGMKLFVGALIVLIGVLVVRDPWFGLLTPAGYFCSFGLLPWPWRLPAVATVALESGTAQADAIPKDSAAGWAAFAVVLAANAIGMCGLAWWEWDSDRKSEQRETALEQAREANRRLQATLAENAGLHQRLLVQARQAGVLDERQRMAREIHDTLAQGFIGVVTQLQAAEQFSGAPDRWRQHFAAATQMAREGLTEARRSVDALRPQSLETAGLAEALAGVAERWSALHGVTVQVTTTGPARPMQPEAELALLRAAQEALANVARHARAATVSLALGYLDHEVTLDVQDDGRGFETSPARTPAPSTAAPVTAAAVPPGPVTAGPGPAGTGPAAAAGGGFGLKAMRERIEELSGTLRVESAPGSGTTVSARVPHGAEEVRA